MTPLLRVDRISVHYGVVEAIRCVSLVIEPGRIVAILGGNGAGKTSLLSAISGAVPTSMGTMSFDDTELQDRSCEERVKLGIVHVPEGRGIFATLTVQENLELGAYTRGLGHKWRRDLEACFTQFPVLHQRRTQRAGTLSGGEQQMLAIARGLMARPRLLLVDEPSLGLSPILVRDVFALMARINAGGTAICLAEQNARWAFATARHAYVLEQGAVAVSGATELLRHDPKVHAAYLGAAPALVHG